MQRSWPWVLVALFCTGVAVAALWTNPGLPTQLRTGLSIFGSTVLGGSVIASAWYSSISSDRRRK